MLFKILVILHTLGATIWTGGHLVLALTILPRALRSRDPNLIRDFESGFEGIGIPSLILQVTTGIWLTLIYLPGFKSLFAFNSYLSIYILIKLVLLLATLILAIHARLFIIPTLTQENLMALGYHIIGVTVIAVLFVIIGTGIRLGGIF